MVVENCSVPFDRRVWREAGTLRSLGYRVSVISPRGEREDREKFVEKEGIRIYRFSVPLEGVSTAGRFATVRYFVEYAFSLLILIWLSIRIYLKKPFQVIHAANPPDTLFFLGLLFKPLGVKYVFDHHDVCPEAYLDKKREPIVDRIYRLLELCERASFKTADLVISTNESYKQLAIRRGGKPENRVFVVRNGPDLTNFHRVEPDFQLKNGFSYLVGYIGIMGKLDGVDYLIRAAHHVVYQLSRREILFLLIGSGPSIRELQQLCKELQLESFVKFAGRIPDDQALRCLSTCDLFASPDPESLLNNISTMNKVMEYMAMGRPIISFDLLETRYSAGAAAVYVANNDWKAFGENIVALLDNPVKREQMGKIAHDRVLKCLSWQVSAKELEKAYSFLSSEARP